MSENTKQAAAPEINSGSAEAVKDYRATFLPSVHRIGRITMVIALVLAFLPIIYFVLVKGYTAPMSSYVSVIVAICSIGIGMWLTEPLAYWPVLGSAGTYIGYLSGNVGAMRFPVALNLQSAMNADINTPRGQVVTIVGIVSSVFANLILLLVFVLGGEWVISVLPSVILASFGFVMQGLFGSMIMMRWNGKGGLIKGFLEGLPYFALALVLKFVISKISFLEAWGMAITVGICILLGYVIYKRDCKKDAEAAK